MARSSEYVYGEDGNWTKKTSNTPDNNSSAKTTGDNLTSSNSDPNSSAGAVEKQYNDVEINTLEGTLNFIATKETIKLKAGDTVKLKGLGKHLSGDYFVKEVTRQISSNGYSHSATLIKTDFGNSLKMTATSVPKQEEAVPSSPQASTAKRTYTVKKGDCLWNIAKQFYGNGAQWGKIYDANTNQIANPDLIYIGQVFVIP